MPKEAEGVGSRIQLKHVRDHGVDHKNAFQEVLAKKQQQEVSVFCFVLFCFNAHHIANLICFSHCFAISF